MREPRRLFIGGAWVAPSTRELISVYAPASEELYVQVASAQKADVERAVAAARAAFDAGPWPRMSHQERAGHMIALAEALTAKAASIAEIWPNEMGILHAHASAIASGVGQIFHAYAAMAESFPFEQERQPAAPAARLGLLVREPVGVVGAIIPWNAPIVLACYKVAPALIAGCTLIIKAAPEAPGHALLLAEAAEEAGLPPGVVNVVVADREASEALVRHPGVDKISFTGSSLTGRRIAAILAERMARYTMELGGKSAAIILDDYDVETAARAIAAQACRMTGQVCAALTRIIVPRPRAEAMADALAAAFAKLVIGDPFDPATQIGPLATRRQRERVEHYVECGKRDGFRVVTGGRRPPRLEKGFFFEPTVFADVDNTSVIAQEEIFGPVLAVVPAKDEQDAIRLANESPFGLNGAVFTHDADRAYRVAREIRSGTFGHNAQMSDFSIGFGGFKQSGLGREGGVEGLLPYLESKTILLAGRPSHLEQPPGAAG